MVREGYPDAPVIDHSNRRNNRSKRRRGGGGTGPPMTGSGNRLMDASSEGGVTLAELEAKGQEELLEMASVAGLAPPAAVTHEDLAKEIYRVSAEQQGYQITSGILEIIDDGYGFLRHNGLRPSPGDVYVSPSQIRRFVLRTGDMVTGHVRPPKEG